MLYYHRMLGCIECLVPRQVVVSPRVVSLLAQVVGSQHRCVCHSVGGWATADVIPFCISGWATAHVSAKNYELNAESQELKR